MPGVGRIGRAVRQFVRNAPELTGLDLIRAEMAVSMADVADGAKRDGKPREAIAAMKDLAAVLEQLESRGEPGHGDGAPRAAAGGGGPAAGVEGLLGSGPVVGH